MPRTLSEHLEDLLEDHFGDRVHVNNRTPCGGGCINHAEILELDNGAQLFLKTNGDPLPRMFECEAEALGAMAKVGKIRVPKPVAFGGREDGVTPFILMEYIPGGSQGAGFQREFGRRFAEFHQASPSDRAGFLSDNYIGSTPQLNPWREDWVEFWRDHRFGFQFELARKSRHASKEFNRLADRLQEQLADLIAEPDEPYCLLHGDLWGGNYMCDRDGEPVLIDPAAYYGRREADLAMTMLFGGFTSEFYAGYEEVMPLAPGSSTRLEIYKLYHLLNHLNLFGGSYLGGCMRIMEKYVG